MATVLVLAHVLQEQQELVLVMSHQVFVLLILLNVKPRPTPLNQPILQPPKIAIGLDTPVLAVAPLATRVQQ